MQEDACRFTGKHRYGLSVAECCRGCGRTRRESRTGRVALWLVLAGFWANALLLLAMLAA